MGGIVSKEGKYSEAIKFYNQALFQDPKYVDAHLDKGIAYQNMEEYQLAKLAFEKVLQFAPSNAKALYGYPIPIELFATVLRSRYGDSLVHLGEAKAGLVFLEKAVHADPSLEYPDSFTEKKKRK